MAALTADLKEKHLEMGFGTVGRKGSHSTKVELMADPKVSHSTMVGLKAG